MVRYSCHDFGSRHEYPYPRLTGTDTVIPGDGIGSSAENKCMNNYLKYLITEDLYLLNEDKVRTNETPDETEEQARPPSKNLVDKTLVIICSNGNNPYRETDRDFLEKILQAVKTSPEIIDLADHAVKENFPENYRMTRCRIIGFLDTRPGLVSDLFHAQKYMIRSSGSNESLLADPLTLIEDDHSKKKILWKKLQDLFKM